MTEEQFLEDERTHKGVMMCLAIIGEAVKNLPPEMKLSHPEIPWKAIAGNRDKIIHAYFGTELSIVWQTVKEKLGPLKEPLKKIR